ncbi:superinfection immunity protein [Nocardioides limicola]|uniref:superinfection immunity protein n=1 Tax=Nocardioides limicola TaxID=2803368 RepID=UPI00193AFB2A|nr:superinfection immunity protein [Nocardioides sp. DJM-14]
MAPLITDQRSTPGLAVIAWIVTLFTAFYMLPWAIATTRGKSNQWFIFWLNLLLGWSVIGWIVALVLSLTSHRPLAYADPHRY